MEFDTTTLPRAGEIIENLRHLRGEAIAGAAVQLAGIAITCGRLSRLAAEGVMDHAQRLAAALSLPAADLNALTSAIWADLVEQGAFE